MVLPTEVAGILRKAFLVMAEDKDYLADAQKVELPVGSPIDGAQISKMIGALAAATTPEVVAQFSRLSATR